MENEIAMNNNLNNINQNSRFWTGIFLVAIGAVLFAVKMGADIPRWLYSWQTFLIGIGIIVGIRHKFRNPSAFIMIFIGAAFLADDYFTSFNFHRYIWPAAIIILGLFFILRPKVSFKPQKQWLNQQEASQTEWQSGFQPAIDNDVAITGEEVLDVTAVFGGIKKRLISKAFRGGDITAFMGGAEIDLTRADIQNTAVLDVSAVFGGVKLIIPADWKVQNKATAVFGGVEDKRNAPPVFSSNKLLIIDGAAVFGGIELKSY